MSTRVVVVFDVTIDRRRDPDFGTQQLSDAVAKMLRERVPKQIMLKKPQVLQLINDDGPDVVVTFGPFSVGVPPPDVVKAAAEAKG